MNVGLLGYEVKGSEVLPEGSPWGKHRVPFLFATNGRPYLRQLRTKSGIWFLDARRAANDPEPLEDWYTPDGLVDLLKVDVDAAYERLKVEPMPYIERDYQRDAILAVEKGLDDGKRDLLVAMATGTGKTRTCIGLCYRLLKTKRFRRVLFLVDRNALGKQTADAFKDLRLENLQTFTDIFDVKELADLRPDRETKLQIATIQAMVTRVIGPHDDASEANIPPVDPYDCIVVDECHRGYLLDRELSEREFQFRNEDDYAGSAAPASITAPCAWPGRATLRSRRSRSQSQKGLVLSAFFVGYMLFVVAGGWLARRYGGHVVLGLAVLGWSAFTLLTPLAAMTSLGALIAARIGIGLGEAALYPAAIELYTRRVPVTERARAMARMLSGIPLGTVGGLPVTGWIVGRYHWSAAFYSFGVLGLAWVVVWFAQVKNDPATDPRVTADERAILAGVREASEDTAAPTMGRLLRHPAVWAMFVENAGSLGFKNKTWE